MKTIEIDLEKDQNLNTLSGMLKTNNIRLGHHPFQLKITWQFEMSNTLYASFLLLLANYLGTERNKITQGQNPAMLVIDKSQQSYYLFYIKTYDVNKLETKIEKDFKMEIAMEKKNPLDEVFGIWKDENITLDKIRSKAWQRTK